jgi:hypothetical protein
LQKIPIEGGALGAAIGEIMMLFGENERISIIGNKELDKHLQSIANLMASSLRTVNKMEKERLENKFT